MFPKPPGRSRPGTRRPRPVPLTRVAGSAASVGDGPGGQGDDARDAEDGRPDAEMIVAERPAGTFTRQLFLGETLDTERIDASYEAGVLTLRIPVAEQAKPRRIRISGGDSDRKQITG
ncbi:Hsp20 family protein [Streptomyces sp. NPDC013313]|uniref:Hsp20/alpha crystallin family protein n=1 Tax=Streptomyces sp. NPDC013313 TaxID=3155603 RepID=UPI0033E8F42D